MATATPDPAISDFPGPDGTVMGIVHDGGTVCSVVELAPGPGAVRLGRTGVVDEHPIPLAILAESLGRHDIPLSGVDIVSHGERVDPGAPTARVHDDLIGPLGATANRTVWLVIRFDAAAQAATVALRGGGSDGAGRALSVATHRIVRRLADAGVGSRVLVAGEIRSVRSTLGAVPTESPSTTWRHVRVPAGHNTGAAVDPRFVGTETLAQVWATRAIATTVTVRVRPTDGGALIGASCRFTTRTPERMPRLPGLAPTGGLECDALASNLPGAPGRLDTLTSFAFADAARLTSLTLSTGGCGQLIGSDAEGRAVAARLVDPDITRVDIIGEHYLARQVVLRALSTGARIVVHTAWPDQWRPLIGMIAAPDRLAFAGDPAAGRPTAALFDGVEPPGLPPHVTALCVHGTPDRISDRATVRIEQPGARGPRIVLWAAGTRADLTMVSTAAESAYIGRPYSGAVPFAPAAG